MGKETTGSIGAWADQTFYPKNGMELGIRAQCLKLVDEATEAAVAAGANRHEILKAVEKSLVPLGRDEDQFRRHPRPEDVPFEIGDCRVVMHVIEHWGEFDVDAYVDLKMPVNRSRKQVVNPDGSAQHVKEE